MDEPNVPIYYEDNRNKVVGRGKLDGDKVLLEITDPDIIKMLKGDYTGHISIEGKK